MVTSSLRSRRTLAGHVKEQILKNVLYNNRQLGHDMDLIDTWVECNETFAIRHEIHEKVDMLCQIVQQRCTPSILILSGTEYGHQIASSLLSVMHLEEERGQHSFAHPHPRLQHFFALLFECGCPASSRA